MHFGVKSNGDSSQNDKFMNYFVIKIAKRFSDKFLTERD